MNLSIIGMDFLVFCLYYILSGIFRERMFEMFMYIGSTLVVMLYCAIEYGVNRRNHSDLKLVRHIYRACACGANATHLRTQALRNSAWNIGILAPQAL